MIRYAHPQSAGRFARWLAVALLALVAGVAQAQPAPAGPQQAPPAGPEQAPPAASAAQSPDYVIGPGDTIQIFVWRNPDLSVTVPVRPDGKISTPLVEDMIAVGKTPSQLARDIEAKLAEYIRTPQVNIIVSNALSRFSEIRVIGQVGKPGAVPYRDGMTVLDVVLECGGLTQFAAGNRAKLVRKDADGKTQDIPVKLENLLKKGRLQDNMPVKPGDTLVVPESYF